MLVMNPPNLKGTELLDHHIARHQQVYGYDDHKHSVSLNCYSCTNNKIIMMNQLHPKIVQVYIMQRFGARGTK